MKTTIAASLFAAVFIVAASVTAADKDSLEGIKCPVSGKDVAADATVAYKDGKVYFCCQGCPNAFKKDTAKFAAKANQQLFATGQYTAVKCPLTGRDLNPAATVKVGDTEVAFCCNGCKGKASKAEGAAQLALVFSDAAFAKGFKAKKKAAE